MAKNIFDVTNDQNNEVHVNGFDWSHQSNFTGRLGYIYPFFTDLVPAKSSFRCSPKLGLQFMPMVFPCQTRMKSRVSFFRMPLRALWKDFKDYVGNFRQGLEEPFLDLSVSFDKFMGTGKLADYLDIPTVLYGAYSQSYQLTGHLVNSGTPQSIFGKGFSASVFADSNSEGTYSKIAPNAVFTPNVQAGSVPVDKLASICYCTPLSSNTDGIDGQLILHELEMSLPMLRYQLAHDDLHHCWPTLVWLNKSNEVISFQRVTEKPLSLGFTYLDDGTSFNVTFKTDGMQFVDDKISVPARDNVSMVLLALDVYFHADESMETLEYADGYFNEGAYKGSVTPFDLKGIFVRKPADDEPNYVEITRSNSPYYDSQSPSKDKQIKLSAYAARTYEAIYNAYLRDNRNNPYYRNGQIEYNVWLPTDDGGADTTIYELHRANWEKDFLTTAVPSPQQGRAPLVGITTYTDTSTVDGITTTALKMALVDENGKRYAVNMQTNEEGVQGVEYAELPEGTSMSPLSYRSLVDAATTGISIPDLRMVNAYQKFLELNMRKGYSYKQIVEGRFDCQVRYDDLNMPEFIGGFTRDVNMNRVVQSIEKGDGTGKYSDALGSLAGDAFLAADGPTISCFCDEESIIMGIISIVPVPNYSQLLPKHYLYRDLLDHFQPEFNNLGFQPITYKEVCPIQAYNAGDDLNAVFGYQRPWYEYVQKTDKVHGLFRTQLRNFLMNRVFDVKPTLTKSFLLVDDEQLNDVFAVTETTDKIIGQIWLDCSVKLPINRVAIPRLD